MPKQILRIEPIHSSQAFASKWKHNMRLGDIPNADSSKTWKNEQLIRLPVGETYLTYFERKIASLPYYDTHKIRKNGIRGFEVFLSFGQGELPPEFTLGQWKRNSIQFLRDVFGRENVAAATLHMDERAPHIHAIVFPVREGRLRARAFLPDRQAMRDLHVKYHEYTRECGLEPESWYMHIKHEKVGRFYSNINLALEKQLPSPMEGERLEAYAVRADECYKDQMLRSLGREQRIRQLEKEKDGGCTRIFLEFPVPLLSTTLKDVFISYVPGLPCSCVLLSDQKERQQHTYWVFEVECLDCLADGTEYYPDGTWKKMVLDEKRIGTKAIFRVNGTVQKPVIIRRDVAESILRRSMLGIKLECVEAERLQSG